MLSESVLASELGFGRTPIREALQRLAREGLVVILPRKGILVSEINPRNQLLVLEARRELERLMARKGAVRQTEEEKAQFLEIADGMEKAARENDDIGFMRHDYALNMLIAKAAHNEYASRAVGLLHGMSRRFWYMHYKEAAGLASVREPACSARPPHRPWRRRRGGTGFGPVGRLRRDLYPGDAGNRDAGGERTKTPARGVVRPGFDVITV